ncbi:DNA repair protein RadA [Basilea psittacipulmonis]|uniref:DNA repair protein RadA n=1 Tax=Basilea psittacipulmonis DSM 24701 TaxID=1072685 RepID=A0A077DDU8_9BURK|nr:DNA repair protein RadA [Basilea psittacipulmonis]AIL32789.1 DNA repair protein RadA [Basilea psittacipulmonis DSM 24701]
MAKKKTQFVCQACGGVTNKWLGQCTHCHAWNTIEEVAVAVETSTQNRFSHLAKSSGIINLSTVTPQEVTRMKIGIAELDRALGGGIVPGGVTLIGGDPGIGKSTLLLQSLCYLSEQYATLYVTGEESAEQVALRAQRLELDTSHVRLMAEIQLETIEQVLETEHPKVVVIDSIQTLFSGELSAAPGSVSQVRECAARLTRIAKQHGISLIMIGHVTKDGALAGPRVLEHIVDTVLYFEGEGDSTYRLIRAIKNRFGAVNELGVFVMTEKGLKGINNPSAIFLSQYDHSIPGSCVMATQEGTRPLLVEIQALVDTTHVPNPRRLSIGLESSRLAMLLAVLNRHAGISTFDLDVFVNAVGGVRIQETAADLPILLAIISSMKNRPLPKGMIAFGEVGLSGEIRPSPRGQERLKEAAKLGFSIALVPKHNAPKQPIEGLEIRAVGRLEEVLSYL